MMESTVVYNMTTINTTGSYGNFTPPTQLEIAIRRTITIASTVIGIASILMNVMFIIASRYLQDKSTPYHRFLKNLSFADIMASATFLLSTNYAHGALGDVDMKNGSYILGMLPFIIRSMPWMFFTGYLLTLLCLSVNQYVAVCKPWRYAEIVTRQAVLISLAVVWLVSSLQVLVPTVIFIVLAATGDRQKATYVIYESSTIEIQLWMAIFTLVTIVNIYLNVVTSQKIKKLKEKFSTDNETERGNIRVKQEAFVTIRMLLVASVVCRLPFPLLGIISIATYHFNNAILNGTLALLLFSNFFVDPIIYIARMSDVRRCHKLMFASCLRGCRKEGTIVQNGVMSEMRLLNKPETSMMMTTDIDAARRQSEWNV